MAWETWVVVCGLVLTFTFPCVKEEEAGLKDTGGAEGAVLALKALLPSRSEMVINSM